MTDTPTTHPAAETSGERIETRLQVAYDRVAYFPENRGGQGFMDLLVLRNLVPEAIAALATKAAADGGAVIEQWPVLPSHDRETLGRIVRYAWIHWASRQANPKPNWLTAYEELSDADKEADRLIGETVRDWVLHGYAAPGGNTDKIASAIIARSATLSHPAAPAPEPAVDHEALVDDALCLAQTEVIEQGSDDAAQHSEALERARTALLARLAELEAEIKRGGGRVSPRRRKTPRRP